MNNPPHDPNNPNGASMALSDLHSSAPDPNASTIIPTADEEVHTASELEAVFDVPVKVQAVLGKAAMDVSQLLKIAPGAVIELDRRVGEAIDIYVNNRLVARGEVVLVDEHLGVTMTEIVKGQSSF
jgi:flagellar motor switch protein FliN/FliY